MSSAGHMTTETVYAQTLALWLGDGDEHHVLESDTTGLNVKGNLYLMQHQGEMDHGGKKISHPLKRDRTWDSTPLPGVWAQLTFLTCCNI